MNPWYLVIATGSPSLVCLLSPFVPFVFFSSLIVLLLLVDKTDSFSRLTLLLEFGLGDENVKAAFGLFSELVGVLGVVSMLFTKLL